jgi:glutamate 5-kinase
VGTSHALISCIRTRFPQHGCTIEGKLHLDAGAVKGVLTRNSLFPAGITRVEGVFSAQVPFFNSAFV